MCLGSAASICGFILSSIDCIVAAGFLLLLLTVTLAIAVPQPWNRHLPCECAAQYFAEHMSDFGFGGKTPCLIIFAAISMIPSLSASPSNVCTAFAIVIWP